MAAKWLHVKKNDNVMVIAGKEKGKSGKVLQVFPSKGRLTIENLNMIKRHKRPTRGKADGGIFEREAALDASNVMIVCGSCNKPTRTGARILTDGTKARFCKKCNELLDK